MHLTSCTAVLSSLLALGVFAVGVKLTLGAFKFTFNQPAINLKSSFKLIGYTCATSLCLLYATTYVTRDLHSGTSEFLSQKIVYENCDKKSDTPFTSEESEDDDDDYEGEEEIASLNSKSCFFNS